MCVWGLCPFLSQVHVSEYLRSVCARGCVFDACVCAHAHTCLCVHKETCYKGLAPATSEAERLRQTHDVLAAGPEA